MESRKILLLFSFYFIVSISFAQTFTEIIGGGNPLNGFDVGSESDPSFADMDADGDLDMISGENDGVFNYYENTGTPTAPNFVQRTGGANPMNGFDVGDDNKMELIDIDGDGDFDLFCGEEDGNINFFENTGTIFSPAYTQKTGASNPMNGEDVGNDSNPSFADIDNDGDYDLLVGEDGGEMYYFENTGDANNPVFTERTGAANPVNGEDIGDEAAPAFVDMDNDGDLDLVVADDGANFSYFENTGTVSVPIFVERTGAQNPLDGFTPDTAPTLTFVDIDGDGDSDAYAGGDDGQFRLYQGDGTGGNPSDVTCNPCYSIANGNFGTSLTWSATSGGTPVTGTPNNNGTVEYIIENGFKVTVDGNYNVRNITVGNGTGAGELEWSGDNTLTFYNAAGIVVAANGTIDRNGNNDAQLNFNQGSNTYVFDNDGVFNIGVVEVGLNETVNFTGATDINIDNQLLVTASNSVGTDTTFWSEDFTSEGNNSTTGNNDNTANPAADWTTSCSSCNLGNEFRVENNEFRIENTDETATWTSEVITITPYSNVEASVSIDMDDNQLDPTDCITISYRLDGGAKTQFAINGNLCDDGSDPTVALQSGLNGTTLQIIIEGITTKTNEDIHFDNITVTGSTSGSAEIGTSFFTRNNEAGRLNVNLIDVATYNVDATNNGTFDLATDFSNVDPGEVVFTQGVNSNFFVGGDLDADILMSAAANGNTVEYDGNVNQDILDPTDNYFHLTASNNAHKDATAHLDVNGNLTISGGARLDMNNSFNLNLAGNWINTSTDGFREGSQNVVFDGVGAQSITCSTLGEETFYNLLFNKYSGGVVTMNNNITVSNILNFIGTNSYIAINSNNLTMAVWNDGEVTGYDSDEFIIVDQTGFVKFTGINAGETLNIPMGLATGAVNYALADLTMTDPGGGTFDANLCDYLNHTGTCSGGTEVTDKVVDYTWNFISSSNNSVVKLYWDGSKEMGAFDRSQSTVIHYDGSQWEELTAFGAATPEGGSIYSRSGTTTSFSPFGAASDGAAPLPVELSSFKANLVNSEVQLNWVTATESNNNYFIIERSTNGYEFEEVDRVDGVGNSVNVNEYSIIDVNPEAGINYYRLTQVDFDGKKEQFHIVTVEVRQNELFEIDLYPNPAVNGEDITIVVKGNNSNEILIVLIDIIGNTHYTKARAKYENREVLTLETGSLPPGIYYISASQNDELRTQKLVIK